jgi:hypothetical protein
MSQHTKPTGTQHPSASNDESSSKSPWDGFFSFFKQCMGCLKQAESLTNNAMNIEQKVQTQVQKVQDQQPPQVQQPQQITTQN